MGLLDKLTGNKSSVFEEAKKSVQKHVVKPLKEVKNEVAHEFGIEKGPLGRVSEFFTGTAENLGIKEPRLGKSFIAVIKTAFNMLKTINSKPDKQNDAIEKFDKACENFSTAMKNIFKAHALSNSHDLDTSMKNAAKGKTPGQWESKITSERITKSHKSSGKGRY